MKRIIVLGIVFLLLGVVGHADCNGAPVTAKGHVALYIDQMAMTYQLKGLAGQDPIATSMTRLGVNYGIAAGHEVGVVRIDDTYIYAPEAKGSNYGFRNIKDQYETDAGLGLLYACELSKFVKLPFDLRFQYEYDLSRRTYYHIRGTSSSDDAMWDTAGMYFGLGATKAVFVPGLVVGGSLGVANAWNMNANPDHDATDLALNQIGTSAFQITAGLDYTIPDTTVTLYTSIGHIDNTNLVGKEDSAGIKARDNKVDYFTCGLRYDI
jgi:hypothetical protein